MEPATTCGSLHCFCRTAPNGDLECHRCGFRKKIELTVDMLIKTEESTAVLTRENFRKWVDEQIQRERNSVSDQFDKRHIQFWEDQGANS